MFGISFSELVLVGLVALLVLGPERLPGAARTAGLWIGRLRRSFNAIKQEVEREIGADEIRRQLHNEHIMSLEQEARKILSPQQQKPDTPDASGTGHTASPVTLEKAPAAPASPSEPAHDPAPASIEPATAGSVAVPHDSPTPTKAP